VWGSVASEVSVALHVDSASLVEEVIDEYLATVEQCLAYRKPDGGCLGYPSALLLFCTVEALGKYHGRKKNPFNVLNDSPFKLRLEDRQIKKLVDWYRNLLAHAGMIAPGTYLEADGGGTPFEFLPDGEPSKIRLMPFYKMVKGAWDTFDSKRLKSELQIELKQYRAMPVDLTVSFANPISASGSNYVPKPIKKGTQKTKSKGALRPLSSF
jgi:hypothetical protein